MIATEDLLEILVCPDCRKKLNGKSGSIACTSCGRGVATEEDVYILTPMAEAPAPALYENPTYQRYIKSISKVHQAHYKEGALSANFEDMLKRSLMSLVRGLQPPVVDIGCGIGSGFKFLGREKDILGVDRELSLLKQCRHYFPQATLINGDMTVSPFANDSLKTVFSVCTLEHVFYLERFLESVVKSLGIDGKFYVVVPTEGGLGWRMMRSLFTAPKYSRMLGLDYKKALSIDHCNTVYAIDSALRKFFKVEEIKVFPWGMGGFALNLGVGYRLSKLNS